MISVNRKHLMKGIFTLPFMMLIIFIGLFDGRSVLGNSFLYFKNGASLQFKQYRINFPFSHWSYYDQNEYFYLMPGREFNGNSLGAELFKETCNINIKDITKECTHSNKKYKNINGNMFFCKNNIMYFVSKDKNILIRERNFDYENKQMILEEYSLLLNNIELITQK